MEAKKIFITVGTTKFDNLIKKLSEDKEIIDVFRRMKCESLKIQYGNGIEPDLKEFSKFNINCEKYQLKPSIIEDIQEADLIISHAGAGTCIEVLREGKPLIVVINEDLMDNHQTELANQLSEEGYLYCCTVNNLVETILNSNLTDLKEFPRSDMSLFIKHLDELMGFDEE